MNLWYVDHQLPILQLESLNRSDKDIECLYLSLISNYTVEWKNIPQVWWKINIDAMNTEMKYPFENIFNMFKSTLNECECAC